MAPTLAAALGLGETLGRAPDGALGLTALARVDGQAQPGVISSGSATQQVVLIVVDGLSDAVLDEFIDGSQGFSKLKPAVFTSRKGSNQATRASPSPPITRS